MFFSRKRGKRNNTKILGKSKAVYAYNNIPISTHAEIDALKKIKNEFSRTGKIQDLDLLVIRISKHGYLSNSKPCYHCIKQLELAYYVKIKNVYYSETNGKIKHITFNNLVNSIYTKEYTFISSGYRMRMNLQKSDDGNCNILISVK